VPRLEIPSPAQTIPFVATLNPSPAEHPKALPVFFALLGLIALLMIVWWMSSKLRGY
jgi:hypothetical protein